MPRIPAFRVPPAACRRRTVVPSRRTVLRPAPPCVPMVSVGAICSGTTKEERQDEQQRPKSKRQGPPDHQPARDLASRRLQEDRHQRPPVASGNRRDQEKSRQKGDDGGASRVPQDLRGQQDS